MTSNMIGRVFNNRYQITERIGIGGMAEVYRAQDNVLGRMVAVKIMLPQYAADPSFTQRFKQEAAAAANLQSPYIVNVYDWGQDGGTYYIVMEFVRGSDLKTAINERGAINQRKVAEIGSQVCQALSVAHGLDIIHRDIKPQNIMVQPDGNVKVMDFGIARAKNSVKTQTSSVLGTAHYISPEQAQGKDLTSASDIYSLGVVLYESVTGKLPFDGPDAVSVAMKQVNELPVAPSEINPEVDPSLEAIIMKALSKNPAERFGTAKDMRSALNDFLAGRPVNLNNSFTSAQTSVVPPIVPPIGAVPGGTAVMPAVGGNPSDTGSVGTRSYRIDDNNKPQGNKKKVAAIIAAVVGVLALAGVAFALFSGGIGASADKNTIDLPDVKGQDAQQAVDLLTQAGFTNVGTEEVFNDTIEAGKVVDQDPRGGTKQKADTKITLSVSKGVQQITVPDLSNMTADQAKKELATNGLKHEAGAAEYSDTVEKDHVIRQEPAAGETVNKDTKVTYYLSLGSDQIEVPDVVNETSTTAKNILQNAGLECNETTDYSDTVPKGTVISQDPIPGSTSLKKGNTVTIVVSMGPKPQYTVTASVAGGGGKVSPTNTSVKEGESATFTIKANPGCTVAGIIDSQGNTYSLANDGTVTIPNVNSNLTVTITFSEGGNSGGSRTSNSA